MRVCCTVCIAPDGGCHYAASEMSGSRRESLQISTDQTFTLIVILTEKRHAKKYADLCNTNPSSYKYCGEDECISRNATCPCDINTQYQCLLGNCIPIEDKCNGFPQCFFGEDEVCCQQENTSPIGIRDATSREGIEILSEPVTVALIVLAVLVIVLFTVIIVQCVKLSSKTRHRTHYVGNGCQKLTTLDLPVSRPVDTTEGFDTDVYINEHLLNKIIK